MKKKKVLLSLEKSKVLEFTSQKPEEKLFLFSDFSLSKAKFFTIPLSIHNDLHVDDSVLICNL